MLARSQLAGLSVGDGRAARCKASSATPGRGSRPHLVARETSRLSTRRSHAAAAAPLRASAAVSPHPDALRRRQEHEKRKLRRAQQSLEAAVSDSADESMPPNVAMVDCMAAAHDALSAGSSAPADRLRVLFFSAPWCHACRSLKPKFRQIASNNQDVQFMLVNVADDALREWCMTSLGLDRLPYFQLYRGGTCVSAFSASLTKISMLRAEVAAHKPCVDAHCAMH